MVKSFYLDTCIWLNLFKKEGDPTKGIPYCELARNFIEKVMLSDDKKILYSGVVLKEIKYKLNIRLFKEKVSFLKEEFIFVKFTDRDYSFARKLETDLNYQLSFYDCLHIAICKRLNLTLVTRDNDLIKLSKKLICVGKPENLLD